MVIFELFGYPIAIGRGRISWEGTLVVRETGDWRDLRRTRPRNFGLKLDILILKQLELQHHQYGWAKMNFYLLGLGRANFWGGITSKLARQYPSWGIYKHTPPAL
jgi:hypothetical protein